MLQTPIKYAMRWMLIGLISTFAIGGSFPGIAAACEGLGEEVVLFSTTTEEGQKGVIVNKISNPYFGSVKIVGKIKPRGTGGAITNEGNCKVGDLITGMGTCTFEQNAPPGAELDAVFD
jgi:hypothetical protein